MKTMLYMLEEQIKKQPDKVIIECDERKISYNELNILAEKVCSYLLEKGVGKNQFVGIIGNRSEKIIIAMLGILKAGAAYIPLDSSFPENRIKYMCEDSKVDIVISISPVEHTFNEGVEVIDIENIISAKSNILNTPVQIDGDDLAYMIYTSGSSGMPKGVMVSHSNLTYFVEGISKEIHFSTDIIIACITTMSFDFFFIESFLPLILGVKIVIFDEICQKDPKRFCDGLQRYSVNSVLLTPSRLRLLLEYDEFYKCLAKLKVLMVGGEPFPASLLDKISGKTPAEIWNVYGPTEATIACSVKKMHAGDEVTIGKPFSNVRYYILDEYRSPVKTGEVGELYIGGKLVSKGYHNKKELTEKSFFTDMNYPDEVMYKTGDLVKYALNGDVIMLGRCDDQVKIRGYRVELGEIEDTIMRYTDVEQAVVKIVENSSGLQQLSCFYKAYSEIDELELKRIIGRYLPEYMIPDFFVKVNNFFYTPNGKIDRKKLEVPDVKGELCEQENVLKTLQTIWGNMSLRTQVDTTRPLFEIGGNSSLIVEFCVKINKLYSIKMSVMQLLQLSTLNEIAAYVISAVDNG